MVVQPEAAFAWEVLEVDRGTKPALALTSDDTPYVAYMLEAQDGFVKSAVLRGESWDISTVAEGYFYGPLDIATGPDDIPHVTYHDHQAPTFLRDKGDAAYAVLRNGEWQVDAVFDLGHDGWDNRIVIDGEGLPHMSAIDPKEFGGVGVEYYGLDESGNWTVESVGSGPQTYKYATSVAVDPSGNPHVTFYDQSGKDLALASRNGSAWTIDAVSTEGETGLFSSLLIDADGRFHISYFEKASDSSGTVKYATRGPDATEWEVRDVGTLDSLVFGQIGARKSRPSPWIAAAVRGLPTLTGRR